MKLHTSVVPSSGSSVTSSQRDPSTVPLRPSVVTTSHAKGLHASPGPLTSSSVRNATASASLRTSIVRSEPGTGSVKPAVPCTSKRMTSGSTPTPGVPGKGAGALLTR
jgi:hypothetical protein